MSKAKKILEELETVPYVKDNPKRVKFEDVPDSVKKVIGFIPKSDIHSITSDLRNYNVYTNISKLSPALIANLAQLGKRLASINSVDDSFIISIKKD